MNNHKISWALGLLFSGLFLAGTVHAHPHIISAKDRTEVNHEEMLADLREAQVIFIGEFHDDEGHHQAQRAIIEALNQDDRPLAIGLEMFRRDSQDELDQWVLGRLSLDEFLVSYEDNWSMWPKYRDIFLLARDKQLPMVGLNIPREITSKVAKRGFEALPAEQKRMLGDVQCVVNPVYGKYIRQAMGGYGGHGQQFLFFCEAQLLWDTMMARNLVDYLKHNPDHRMVVLAGSGHAWKYGIPRQMLEQSDLTYRVVLPEVFGRIDRLDVNSEITDYLWLDVGEDGWEFSF